MCSGSQTITSPFLSKLREIVASKLGKAKEKVKAVVLHEIVLNTSASDYCSN